MSNATAVSDLERAEHIAYGESKGVKRVSVFNEGTQVSVATEAKQDDMIEAINGISGITTFSTNEILDAGGSTYFFKETKDGVWYVKKYTNGVYAHATVTNNPTVISYADALSGYATLTYSNYSEAF